MLQHVEWTATDLLADPLLHAVADAKWRVTTLRQRLAKLQAQLDVAIADEKKVMSAAEAFMETGRIPGQNQVRTRHENGPGRKLRLHVTPEAPPGEIYSRRGGVADLDELEGLPRLWRVIHDLGDANDGLRRQRSCRH